MPSTINYYQKNKTQRLQYQTIYRILQKLGHININTKSKKKVDAIEPVFKKTNKAITLSFD